MAHIEQLAFFQTVLLKFSDYLKSEDFLGFVDLGSLNINGGPQEFIPQSSRYIGVDLGEGPNVDIICPIELIDLPSQSFSVAISSEMLEHNPFWLEALFTMCRLTTPGGLIVWTCAGIGRPEHGTTRTDGGSAAPFVTQMGVEYYKNISAKEALNSFNHNIWFDKYAYFENFESKDTYFIGLRKGSTTKNKKNFEDLVDQFSSDYIASSTLRSYFHSRNNQAMVNACIEFSKRKRYLKYYSWLFLKFYERSRFKKLIRFFIS